MLHDTPAVSVEISLLQNEEVVDSAMCVIAMHSSELRRFDKEALQVFLRQGHLSPYVTVSNLGYEGLLTSGFSACCSAWSPRAVVRLYCRSKCTKVFEEMLSLVFVMTMIAVKPEVKHPLYVFATHVDADPSVSHLSKYKTHPMCRIHGQFEVPQNQSVSMAGGSVRVSWLFWLGNPRYARIHSHTHAQF